MKILYTILFILSLIGIYIYPQFGIRVDHIIIYLLLFFGFILFIASLRHIELNFHITNILFLLIIFLFIGSLPKILNNKETDSILFLAQFENFLQPIALIIITGFITSKFKKKFTNMEIMTYTIEIYLIFLALNSILAIYMLYIGPGDYIIYLAGSPDKDGLTAIERALGAGRSGGVFNQPFDAGLAYSIGLLCWAYLFNIRKNIIYKRLYYMTMPIIFIGSFFSGSKVSQFLGTIFFIVYLILDRNLLKVLFDMKVAIYIFFTIISLYGIFIFWDGEIELYKTLKYFILNRII